MTLHKLEERTGQKIPVLVTVNGGQFELHEALQRSMFDAEGEGFLELWISELLVRQYADQNNISNSTEELQVAANEFRYSRGLESVEKLQQWLKSNQQSILSLQNYIDHQLLRKKIVESVPEKEIEEFFAEHQLDFDRVALYSMRLCSKELAEELYALITEEGENFHLLTMKYSTDDESRPKGGYIGKMRRHELGAEIEAAVFNAEAGEVIGPIETENGYNLFKVGAVYPASLEEEKENIRYLLFGILLNRLRGEAKVIYPIFEEE